MALPRCEFYGAPTATFNDTRTQREVLDWRDRIKRKVGNTRVGHFCDALVTAFARLLEPGADPQEIATAMGGCLAHAPHVIERFDAMHPGMTDALGRKLAMSQRPT